MKKTQIYVGGLPSCSPKKTVVILTSYFAKYGDVEDVLIPPKKSGFAFVKFANEKIAAEVCKKGSHEISGRKV